MANDVAAAKQTAAQEAGRKTRVFLSYSRRDAAFADQLLTALNSRGFEAYLDKKDILPGEPWRERLGGLILTADAVAFVISPDSMASDVCAWEVDETERLQKKLLPVLYRPVPDSEVPPRLARLNYIFLRAEDNFDTGVATLGGAIDTDIAWIRQHTRMGELSRRWVDASRPASGGRLLRGEELTEAERWLLSSPKTAPDPTEAQRAFVQCSRAFETREIEKERAQVERTRRFQKRFSWALGGVALLVVAGGMATAQQMRRTQLREAKVAASIAEKASTEGRWDRVMRIALQDLPPKGALPFVDPWSSELEARLAGSTVLNRLRIKLKETKAIDAARFTTDGKRLVGTLGDQTARQWDASTGAPLLVIQTHSCSTFQGDTCVDKDYPVAKAPPGVPVVVLDDKTCSAGRDAFSPDGTRLLTNCPGNSARISDIKTGATIATLKGDATCDLVTGSAVFSADGSRIAITCFVKNSARAFHENARLFDASTGALVAELKSDTNTIDNIALNADGSKAVSWSREQPASVWNAATGALVAQIKENDGSPIEDALFSPDGTRVLTRAFHNYLRLWDAATGIKISEFRGHTFSINSMAFSPDGARVVTASSDKTARIWDAASGRQLKVLEGHTAWINRASFSSDGARIVTASDDATARVWDTDSGIRLDLLAGHEDYVRTASFSPDGSQIVTVSKDETARLWDVKGQSLVVLKDYQSFLKAAAFSPDRTKLATASSSHKVQLWNAATGAPLRDIGEHKETVTSIVFSADGARLLTASEDRTARLWDATTGAVLLELPHGYDKVSSAAFGDNGTRIVTAAGNNAYIWDAKAGTRLSEFKGHNKDVSTAALGPDGRLLITSSSDDTARIWQVATPKESRVLEGHGTALDRAIFSPDGKRALTGDQHGGMRLWDVASGAPVAVLTGHAGNIKSLAYSKDGAWILTGSSDYTARLWDAADGMPVVSLNLSSPLTQADFNPDETGVLSVSFVGGMRASDVSWATKRRGADLRDRVCAEKLPGAQAFTDLDASDPILAGLAGTNPCSRRGPLSSAYYAQRLSEARDWLTGALRRTSPPGASKPAP